MTFKKYLIFINQAVINMKQKVREYIRDVGVEEFYNGGDWYLEKEGRYLKDIIISLETIYKCEKEKNPNADIIFTAESDDDHDISFRVESERPETDEELQKRTEKENFWEQERIIREKVEILVREAMTKLNK